MKRTPHTLIPEIDTLTTVERPSYRQLRWIAVRKSKGHPVDSPSDPKGEL